MTRTVSALVVALAAAAAAWPQAAPEIPQVPEALAWAYAMPPLPAAGSTPPAAAAGRASTPPAAPTRHRLEGSTAEYTMAQVNDGFAPPDWFPDSHPTMPPIVAQGKKSPTARACALCHLPNGKGRPENAPIAGLPLDYFLQQLEDFRSDLRKSAEPRKENAKEMAAIAKALTDDESKAAAEYYSSMAWTPWVKVVEAETIPRVRLTSGMYFRVEDGSTEPLGRRIIESPENGQATLLRDPRSGFIAYVPMGSLKAGEALVTTGGGGRTTACTACHGPELKGLGPIPGIAGRSPSYLARQIFDMQQGAREGAMSGVMMPVIEKLTPDDIIAIVAYVASR